MLDLFGIEEIVDIPIIDQVRAVRELFVGNENANMDCKIGMVNLLHLIDKNGDFLNKNEPTITEKIAKMVFDKLSIEEKMCVLEYIEFSEAVNERVEKIKDN